MRPVFLILALLGAAPLPAQETAAPEVIRNATGQALRNPRILSFNGTVFQVEHAEGVAGVPWERMPPAWRAGYQFRPPPPPVASSPSAPQATPALPAPAPERSATNPARPPAPKETEIEVPVNEQLHLRDYGANRGVTVLREDPESLTVAVANFDKMIKPPTRPAGGGTYSLTDKSRTSGYGAYDPPLRPETAVTVVPQKLGFAGQRQLLYEDPTGVKVYLVHTLAGAEGRLRLAVVPAEGSAKK